MRCRRETVCGTGGSRYSQIVLLVLPAPERAASERTPANGLPPNGKWFPAHYVRAIGVSRFGIPGKMPAQDSPHILWWLGKLASRFDAYAGSAPISAMESSE